MIFTSFDNWKPNIKLSNVCWIVFFYIQDITYTLYLNNFIITPWWAAEEVELWHFGVLKIYTECIFLG